MTSPEYEDNVYESQGNFFEENADSDINKPNDLIRNLCHYFYEPEKDARESSGSDSNTNEDESIKKKTILPTMPR